MWKSSVSPAVLDRASAFDAVIEPGEFAGEIDSGPTVHVLHAVKRTRPIVLLDQDDLLPTAAAKEQLGLDAIKPAVLVQLGAGNINDVHSLASAVTQQLLDMTEWQLCVAQSAIAQRRLAGQPRVTLTSVFPLSAYRNAFNFGIAAAGYNTYHESLSYALPTIFVPNQETKTDDQVARARYAEQVNVGLCIEGFSQSRLAECLEVMGEAKERLTFEERCRTLNPGNGAGEAMHAVEAML